jgi:hypothetical protein
MNATVTFAVDGISALLALIVVGFAVKQWRILQDRHSIASVIGFALREPKALWAGMFLGIFYLATFMILGGKGGRIHVLFGRLIWNTTPWEVLAGLVLAILVMISMTLFVYGVSVMGLTQSGKKGGMGFFGSLLALLAAFCP